MCLFALPLSVLGVFLERLISPALNDVLTMVAVALPVMGIFVAFVTVFGIVDVRAAIALVLPSRRRA